MSGLDDNNYTMPEGGTIGLSAEDWKRAEKAEKKIREKLAKTCKHLVKGPSPKKRKVDWEKIRAERERLEQEERDAMRIASGFEE